MTTTVIVSIPYVQEGNEVVINTMDSIVDIGKNELEYNENIAASDVTDGMFVKSYTIWDNRRLDIYERRKV
jgi:hypothetical protein